MRRPSLDATQAGAEAAADESYEEAHLASLAEEEAVQSGTCKAGQSCMGCFSGVMLAYMGLLLFNRSAVVISMMVRLVLSCNAMQCNALQCNAVSVVLYSHLFLV
jgi:hypothetical protein